METERESFVRVKWSIDKCNAEAEIVNKELKEVTIHSNIVSGNSFCAKDEEFVREVHKALSSLIQLIDKEKGLGRDLDE